MPLSDIDTYFEKNVITKFIEDITNTIPYEGLIFSMFKSICYDDDDKENYYYAERININHRNGFKLGRKNTDEFRMAGFETNVDDPRLVCYRNKIYIIFNAPSVFPYTERCMGISEFGNWSPKFLRIRDIPPNFVEKNWTPFVKDDQLLFLYNHDPLIVIKYDVSNEEGICDIIYIQDNIKLPINTNDNNYLRGGSNMIQYHCNNCVKYYITASHDRIFYKDRYNHFTRFVLLDTNKWKIVYVSKPIKYVYDRDDFIRIENTNILYDYCQDYYNTKTYLIQYPTSISHKSENIYYLTMFVSEKKSLLYEIILDIDEINKSLQHYELGEIQNRVKEEMIQLIDAAG